MKQYESLSSIPAMAFTQQSNKVANTSGALPSLIKKLPRQTHDAHLVGYYGMQNSGDDALLAATVWGAETFYHASTLSASTTTDIQLFDHQFTPNLIEQQRFRGQRRLQSYRAAYHSKRIIFGGGSVLHTAQDIQVKRHMMKLSQGNEHIAVGIGVGPFKNRQAESECIRFLNECTYVAVRDKESYDIAKSIAPNANIRLAFDLAPLLLQNTHFDLQETERSGIAVSLCPWERLSGNEKAEQARLQHIAQSLIHIHQESGEYIHLVDFNGHPLLGDHQVHLELKAIIGNKAPCRIQCYDANPFRVLQRLASHKAVISMRLHGSILGFIANTPVLSLNYHNKCNGWCQSIGMPSELSLDLPEVSSIGITSPILQGLEHGFNAPNLTRSDAIRHALKNWITN